MHEIEKYIRNDHIVMDAINDFMIDQSPRDRLHYKDIALEAMLSPAGKSKMIQQLYVDIVSKNNIDFGKIPLSKGDITSYEYYDAMYKSIETLNVLFQGKKIEELDLMNKLHDTIITLRGDFEFGFKFDIEILKVTYNLLVLSLYDMINICIVAYTNYLKEVKATEFKFKTFKKENVLIIKFVKDFIKSYEKGEWTKMMLAWKKNPSNLLGSLGAIASSGAAAGVVSASAITIISILSFLLIVRGMIYVYYNSSMRISQYAKINAEFLKNSIKISNDNTASSLEKQNKMLNMLESVSDFIETKIIKTNHDAKKDLVESNKTDFNSKELSDTSNQLGIELL